MIHANGGSGPYIFTVSNGSLPPGLTLMTDGDLSGTFTAEGTFTFTILATDQNNCTGKRQYTIDVKCPDIKIKPNHLPNGTVGNPYSKTITASAGTAPYAFTVQSGSLPDGLTLSTGGVLSGTPTAEGTFMFEVVAKDAYGCTGKHDYTVSVKCHDITLSPSSLPGGRVNHPYSKAITANGGVGPYTFTIENGNLPDGLHLSADGVISGTPTDDGTFYFTVEVKDSVGCDGKRQYWIQVKGCPSISVKPTDLPNGKVGTPYNKTMTASGGDAPYTFTVTNGHLPDGLTLSTGGTLSGTPTAAGGFNFTITGRDAFECSGKRNYSVTISSH